MQRFLRTRCGRHRLLRLLLCVCLCVVAVRADVEAGSTGSGSNDTTSPTTPPPTTTEPPTITPTPPPVTTKPPTKPPTPPPSSGSGSGTPEVTTPAPTTTPPPTSSIPTDPPTTVPPDSDSGSGSIDGGFNSSSNKSDVSKNNQSPSPSSDNGTTKYTIIVAVAIFACVVLFALIFVRRRLKQKKEESDKELQSELDRLDLERGAGFTVAGNHHQFQSQVQTPPLDRSYNQSTANNFDHRASGSSQFGKNSISQSPASWSSSWTTAVGSLAGGGGGGVLAGGDRDSLSSIWRDPDILAARIPFEKILFRNVMTRGGFGEVLEGYYHGQRVAIKRLLPENRRRMACLEEFLKEVQLLSTLEHDRIVQFIGVAWDSPRDLCVVLEYMAHGDLRNALSQWRQEGRKTGWHDVRKVRIALHIAEALTYLHTLTPKIVHRDLKSKNVLLNEHWQAKVTDFGVSREESSPSQRTMTSNVGSSLWIAPEVMLGSRYDEKADIFSFGIVLTELDSMQLPYHSAVSSDGRKLPDAAVLHMVTMGKLQAEFSSMSRTDMVLLGRACLNVDPTLRPNAGEVRYRLAQILGTY